jgi:hypothetical protein
MGSTKIIGVIGLVITLMLSIGALIMNQICDINSETITNQEWLEISNNLCQTFTYLAEFINNVVNP